MAEQTNKQKTDHSEQSFNSLALDAHDVATENETTNWQEICLKTSRVMHKLKFEHTITREKLAKENDELQLDNQSLRKTLAQLKEQGYKQLKAERELAWKNTGDLNEEISDLRRTHAASCRREEEAKVTIDSLRRKISEGQKEAEQREDLIKQSQFRREDLQKRISELEGVIVGQDRHHSMLKEEILKMTCEVKSLDHVLEIYSDVAEPILNRKRELTKPSAFRDKDIVYDGNKAAHGGTCLPEAYRIMSTNNSDSKWFKEYYGVTVETALQFEQSKAFIALFNMRYEMFCYKKNFEATADVFEENFQAILKEIEEKWIPNAEMMEDFLVGAHRETRAQVQETNSMRIYEKLCTLWEERCCNQ